MVLQFSTFEMSRTISEPCPLAMVVLVTSHVSRPDLFEHFWDSPDGLEGPEGVQTPAACIRIGVNQDGGSFRMGLDGV